MYMRTRVTELSAWHGTVAIITVQEPGSEVGGGEER